MSSNANKVLHAFVKKFRSNDPVIDLTEITPGSLHMDDDTFYSCLKELEINGKISGLVWNYNGTCLYDSINIINSL